MPKVLLNWQMLATKMLQIWHSPPFPTPQPYLLLLLPSPLPPPPKKKPGNRNVKASKVTWSHSDHFWATPLTQFALPTCNTMNYSKMDLPEPLSFQFRTGLNNGARQLFHLITFRLETKLPCYYIHHTNTPKYKDTVPIDFSTETKNKMLVSQL